MAETEKVVFKLRTPTSDRVYMVQHWGNYGTVFPDVATTNGSHLMTARAVMGMLKGGYVVIDSTIPEGSFDSEEALRTALKTSYDGWNVPWYSQK